MSYRDDGDDDVKMVKNDSELFVKKKEEETPSNIDVLYVNIKSDEIHYKEGIVCMANGEGWINVIPEENRLIFVRHNELAKETAVVYKRSVVPTHLGSGLAGGTLQVLSGAIVTPLKGVADFLYLEPYKHIKADPSWKSVGKGILQGTKSLVKMPFNVVHETLEGSKKIVLGVINTPEAMANWYNDQRYDTIMGWTPSYKIKDLKSFPGQVGDMICIHQTLYSHCMLKINDQQVIHRSGHVTIKGKDSSINGILSSGRHAECSLRISTLSEIKEMYAGNRITIENAQYCIVTEINGEKKTHYIYKAFKSNDIIKNATRYMSDSKEKDGWNLVFKNCEHFCFVCRYGVHFSGQIQSLRNENDFDYE